VAPKVHGAIRARKALAEAGESAGIRGLVCKVRKATAHKEYQAHGDHKVIVDAQESVENEATRAVLAHKVFRALLELGFKVQMVQWAIEANKVSEGILECKDRWAHKECKVVEAIEDFKETWA
jgi:hypothetical protein